MSTALITGASAGIGKAFAEQLAARGTNLVLVARSEDKLQEIASDLKNKHQIQVDVIVKDLTEANAAQFVFDITDSQGLTIDVLINNAGFGDYGEFSSRDGEKQIKMIQLNILSLVDLTHKFLPLMRINRAGTIINISSIAAFQPMPYLSVYAASKAFVLNFSEALWAENRDYGVKVLVVCPGPTETNFFNQANFPESFTSKTSSISAPDEVVKDTLAALETNKQTIVNGGFVNNLITNLPRFLPRETIVGILEKQFKS
ncbi:MAG: SDR family NAD(P)-dependent oxidoreductase [Mastigocoleus sp.]|mgnify:CR=1 FL=1